MSPSENKDALKKIRTLNPYQTTQFLHKFYFKKIASHYSPFQYPVNRKFPDKTGSEHLDIRQKINLFPLISGQLLGHFLSELSNL
jgi:hypothetical protein